MKTTWEVGNSPPRIEEHTKNKHKIYGGYLRRYIKKLTSDPRYPQLRLSIIDGFCGGGVYEDKDGSEYFGSPFIVFNVVHEEIARIEREREKEFEARISYYFVDSNQNHIDFLKNAHKEYGVNIETSYPVKYFNSKFEDVYSKIIEDIKREAPRTQRALFILDQYGWSKVEFPVLNNIFQNLTHAEVILTFTPDEIISYASKNSTKISETLRRIGFDITEKDIIDILSMESHPDRYIARAVAHDYIMKDMQDKLCSKYFTRYLIKRENSRRCLMLIHLSQHPTAHNEMVEEHWATSNEVMEYQGPAGVSPTLGYIPDECPLFESKGENFFSQRRQLVISAMIEQIPPILHSYQSKVTFGGLLSNLMNSSPITVNIMKEVLRYLVKNNYITLVCHKTRRPKGGSSNLHLNDIIIVSNQKYFNF